MKHLTTLPSDILNLIFTYLQPIDMVNLQSTNHTLQQTIRSYYHHKLDPLHLESSCDCSVGKYYDQIDPLRCPDCKTKVHRNELSNHWGYCDECFETMFDAMVFINTDHILEDLINFVKEIFWYVVSIPRRMFFRRFF